MKQSNQKMAWAEMAMHQVTRGLTSKMKATEAKNTAKTIKITTTTATMAAVHSLQRMNLTTLDFTAHVLVTTIGFTVDHFSTTCRSIFTWRGFDESGSQRMRAVMPTRCFCSMRITRSQRSIASTYRELPPLYRVSLEQIASKLMREAEKSTHYGTLSFSPPRDALGQERAVTPRCSDACSMLARQLTQSTTLHLLGEHALPSSRFRPREEQSKRLEPKGP